MPDTMKCPKCKEIMTKKGQMLSGNFKFFEYICKCGHKEMKAVSQDKSSGI